MHAAFLYSGMKNATNLGEQVRIQLATRSFGSISQLNGYRQNRTEYEGEGEATW